MLSARGGACHSQAPQGQRRPPSLQAASAPGARASADTSSTWISRSAAATRPRALRRENLETFVKGHHGVLKQVLRMRAAAYQTADQREGRRRHRRVDCDSAPHRRDTRVPRGPTHRNFHKFGHCHIDASTQKRSHVFVARRPALVKGADWPLRAAMAAAVRPSRGQPYPSRPPPPQPLFQIRIRARATLGDEAVNARCAAPAAAPSPAPAPCREKRGY